MSSDTQRKIALSPMQDIQAESDNRQIPIQRVGVSKVSYPLIWHEPDGCCLPATGDFSLSASLAAHMRGTHMSRFMEHLQSNHEKLSLQRWYDTPVELAELLGADTADAIVRFRLFRKMKAPVTGRSGMQAYDVMLHARTAGHGKPRQLELKLELPIATVCPCSREISDRGAHNQRGTVLLCGVVRQDRIAAVQLSDIVAALEECSSVALYPILKRSDEKWVTERGYDTAKFVEDVARDVVLKTRELDVFDCFDVTVENQESIHTHNAFAFIQEGYSEQG